MHLALPVASAGFTILSAMEMAALPGPVDAGIAKKKKGDFDKKLERGEIIMDSAGEKILRWKLDRAQLLERDV